MKSERMPARPDTAAARRLQEAASRKDLFHAYLFEGSRAANEALADWFTAVSLCERQDGRACGVCAHCRQIADGVSPYIVRVKTAAEALPADERFEKRMTDSPAASGKKTVRKTAAANSSNKIKDSQIEDVLSRSTRSSLTGEKVLTVIDRAETITPKGQNRLLKILEEPPEGISIILLTSNAEAILDTIRSRCMVLRTDAETAELEIPGKPAFRKRAARAACDLITGVPAFRLWKEFDYFAGTREKALDFCQVAQVFYRDVMMAQDPGRESLVVLREESQVIGEAARAVDFRLLDHAVHACETAVRDLEANVSMKHALRSLMFSIQLEQSRR